MSNKIGNLHIVIVDNGYHLSTSSGEASYTLDGIPTLKMGIVDNLPDKLTITDRRSLPSAINVSAEHASVTLADCKKRFGEGNPMHFGGFPNPTRKMKITISGLEKWEKGIVSGATVKVDVIQKGNVIHSEVFSGKSTTEFSREVTVQASFDDIIAVHNRPDLPGLKVSAEFIDGESKEKNDPDQLATIISEQVRQLLIKESKPGGLLHKR